jgi:hypothetical protein
MDTAIAHNAPVRVHVYYYRYNQLLIQGNVLPTIRRYTSSGNHSLVRAFEIFDNQKKEVKKQPSRLFPFSLPSLLFVVLCATKLDYIISESWKTTIRSRKS